MLGLSGNQQGAWPQRSHSSLALLPGPAVSFCVKERNKLIFFLFYTNLATKVMCEMKINASFTPNNVQKETRSHTVHHGDFQLARKYLYARSERRPISNKRWIIHARTRSVFTAEQTPRSKFPFDASERPLPHSDLSCFFFALRNRLSNCITWRRAKTFHRVSRTEDGVVINSQWEKTLELCKGTAWWFNLSKLWLQTHPISQTGDSFDPQVPGLSRVKTSLWQEFHPSKPIPSKRSGLAGLGAKVKKANYKTFWFSANSTFSLVEEQVLRSWGKPRLIFTSVAL